MLRQRLALRAAILCALLSVALAHADSVGKASFYGYESGSRRADEKPFRPLEFGAAHWTMPLGTRVRVFVLDYLIEAQRPVWHSDPMDIEGLHPAEVLVRATRRALAFVYLRGFGIEVGAGTRPVLLPEGATCFYGDIRDAEALDKYFGPGSAAKSPPSKYLDAQTLDGVENDSLDFVISAHVIEHLPNALGSLRHTIRVLKPGGILMLVVPDKRHTFDRDCPLTPLQHFLDDAEDNGQSTLLQSYIEHERYVRPTFTAPLPEDQIEDSARDLMQKNADVHRHYWTTDSLQEMILHEAKSWPISLLTMVPVLNENIAIIQRHP